MSEYFPKTKSLGTNIKLEFAYLNLQQKQI